MCIGYINGYMGKHNDGFNSVQEGVIMQENLLSKNVTRT